MKTTRVYPPKLFLKLFRWFCHPKMQDYIEGDLMEVYEKRLKKSGKRIADLRFVIDVILLFRPGIIRPQEGYQRLNTYGMYKSYFKVGWRNLVRSKGYSLINIGGLAIGMMVAMLNGLWIWHEFSFNRYFDNYERIAQIAESGDDADRGGRWMGTTMTYPLSTALMENYRDQFKRITRTTFQYERIIIEGEKMLMVRGLNADENFTEMFSLKMMRGTRNALTQPQSIIISESLAATLFGTEDPINKTINKEPALTVVGVYEDFPQNTAFYGVRFILPWSFYLQENKWIEDRAMNDWRNHFLRVYIEINEGIEFSEVLSNIKPALQFDPEDAKEANGRNQALELYPMSDWHLYPEGIRQGRYDALEPTLMLKLVGAIGLFVLILACINFVNLSTARAEKRAKEIGIRKTIGSIRSQLVNQFFSESFLIVVIAFVFALGLTVALLPGFNVIATKNIVMPWTNAWFWLACFTFIFFTSVLAGIYPALYLSSFNPVKALKGTFQLGRMSTLPRKILVVFQFSISIILITGTTIVYQQIQFAKDRPVGYNRDGLIMIAKRSKDYNGKYEALRNELKNTGVVFEVSESMGPTTEIYSNNNGWDWSGRGPDFDKSFATLAVSPLHGKTVGWQFIKGRDFDPAISSDSMGLIINEAALKIMKLENPIGEPVSWTWWSDKSRVMNYKILGVVKDMVMNSPYRPTEPTMFYLKGLNGIPSWINIKISPDVSVAEALPNIESAFKRVIPTVPFDYKFADEEYAMKFGKEERIGKLAGIFAILAIVISCLGLLGLASFVAERRTKEIGIRKILGATVTELWRMLSRDFVWLVLIACIISAPIAFYLLDRWLQKFQYRTTISIWLFLYTGLITIGITLITVSYQSVRAALMNPVKSLRSE